MPKLSSEIAKFLGRSRRAAAAGFLTYLGFGALQLVRSAPPPLDVYLSWLCAVVGGLGLVAAAFVALRTAFGLKD